jgi:hypothetical protein
MKGKVFKNSINVYQDQAKLLFDFYHKSAEKIVNEEILLEKEIELLTSELEENNQNLSKTKLWKWILAIFIIPFIVYYLKEKRIKVQIAELEDKIASVKKQHDEIFRDYKVNRLGVAYVPVANQISFDDKTFLIDYTGQTSDTEIKLQLSKNNELLVEKVAELEQLSKSAPNVESSDDMEEVETENYSTSMQTLNQHDYFGKLDRALRTISYCMDDLEVSSVELPLVAENSTFLEFLKEHAATDLEKDATIIHAFDPTVYEKDLSKFQELNKLKDSFSRDSEEFEDVLKKLISTMANSVQAITSLKVASANKLIYESNSFLYKVLKSPYNHYSPTLEATEIDRIKNESFDYSQSVQDYVPFQLKISSLMKYNMLTDNWVAEDGSTSNMPFGVHQIYEEIVAPIVQSLMQENRLERLSIYNHIKDQKINYLNQWHQDTEDFYGRNRAESADLINLMRASLRDYVAAYNTMVSLQRTEESMKKSEGTLENTLVEQQENSAETLAVFEKQSSEFQAVQMEFESYMERLKDDIDEKAAKFEHIEYYDALLSDGHFNESAVAASEIHEIDERRRPLLLVNPLFAKKSDLLPKPSMEDVVDEHFLINLPSLARNTLRELNNEMLKTDTDNDFNSSANSTHTYNSVDVTSEPIVQTDSFAGSQNIEDDLSEADTEEIEFINENKEIEVLSINEETIEVLFIADNDIKFIPRDEFEKNYGNPFDYFFKNDKNPEDE